MAVWSVVSFRNIVNKNRLDSEYYLPEYLILEEKLERYSNLWKLYDIASVIGGKRLPKGESFSEEGVPYVRTVDIQNVFVDFDKVLNISDEIYQILKRYQLKFKDILVTIVGSIGLIGYMQENIFPCNFTENCAVIRSREVAHEYLLAVFLSKVGQYQINREKVGTIQDKLALERLRKFLIPKPATKEIEISIITTIKEASEKYKQSKSLYSQAEQILLEELGLKDLDLKDDLFYTTTFKEIKNNNRMDAYFFQPKFNKYLAKIVKKYELKKIRDLSRNITTGQYCDEYVNEQIGVPYIRGADISNANINMDSLVYIDREKQITSKKAKEGDVVTTRVGTIGLVARIPKELEGATISDNLIRIRLPQKSDISSYYLTMYLNSPIGKDLMVRYSRGSVQQRLNQETLKEIPVPIIAKSQQSRIEEFLINSWERQKQAKNLLEQAKKKVEEMIEKEAGVR